MLYLIGLGLGDAKDITVKGLEVVRRCSRVYLEAYTSVLTVGKEVLEEFYGRKVILADREEVEQEADNILKDADNSDVAFLVVGDPFGATTHSDLILRATKLGIPYRVIHNASIINAVGCCGLQLYKFGETVSVVFWTDTWRPESFFDKVKKNRQNSMHTLCLLAVTEETLCVGLARVGAEDQKIAAGTLQQMCTVDLGGPLHSLIITGDNMHPLEMEMLSLFSIPEKSSGSQSIDGL
ncbi:diphthine methyl ester synthase isoform X2 [Manis pentadactyla]|uniref:diphthine methyl ester synthase isoform X2 n=1 Tax=Manis pentadactyla TaxID=143292 RepID=UPI001875BF55|nr:diphthine methyl ester synthase isoform X2 [Manis pentadactyla]